MKIRKKIFMQIFTNSLIFCVLFVLVSVMFFQDAKQVSVSENDDVFYHGNTANKNVTLMVNVYWGEEFLDDMLKIFEKYDVKTTFFVGGTWATKNTEFLKKIASKGHEIGSHGFFHKDHSKLNYAQNVTEIKNTHNLVKELLNQEMNLFAPPSGAFNKDTILAAKNLGYKTILWSRDTIDWRDHDEQKIFDRATKISNGDFVLMHPTKCTLASLDSIIASILGQGFKIIPISANISANII